MSLSEDMFRIIISAGVVNLRQPAYAAQVVAVILPVETPPHFGQRAQARQEHVFGMGPRSDVLGPEVGLHAQYTALFVSRQHLVRIERIDLLHRQITADGERFSGRIARLVIVQIAVRRRSHDGVVAHLRSLDAAFGAPPRHDRSRRRHVALKNLVPADQPASVGVEEFLDAGRVIIAVERNKPAAIAELSKIAAKVSAPGREVAVKGLPARYPQGAEKVLIQACTGRKVPPGGLPADVGCVVMNVTSAAVLARYLKTGMPLVTKRITVDGSAVAHPQNIRVTIGTPIHEVLAFAGGLSAPVHKLLMGGPMMGLALMDDQLPVLKQNNAILAFAEPDARMESATTCIRCGRCIRHCPLRLMPSHIVAAYEAGNMERLAELKVNLCMECGCCSFGCPAHRPLVQTNKLAKAKLAAWRKAQSEKLDAKKEAVK